MKGNKMKKSRKTVSVLLTILMSLACINFAFADSTLHSEVWGHSGKDSSEIWSYIPGDSKSQQDCKCQQDNSRTEARNTFKDCSDCRKAVPGTRARHVHFRPKTRSTSRRRRRRHQPSRQRQLIRLDYDGIARSGLLMTTHLAARATQRPSPRTQGLHIAQHLHDSARSDSSAASLSASARIAAPAFRRAASIRAARTTADTGEPSLVKISSALEVSSSGRNVIVSAISTSVRQFVRHVGIAARAGLDEALSSPWIRTTLAEPSMRRGHTGSSKLTRHCPVKFEEPSKSRTYTTTYCRAIFVNRDRCS